MSAWIVYSKDGLAKCEARKIEYNGEFMGACSVGLNISSPSPIGFEIGDWVEYRGERFELNYDPSVVKESSSNTYGEGFVYENVVFNSLSDELTRCDFLDVVPNDNQIHYTSLPTFSFYANDITKLAERIQANLDRVCTGIKKWTIEVHPEYVNTKDANISVNNLTCWDALALVKSQFDANFIIRGRKITIGTSGIAVGNLFTYGKGNGLYKIERNAESNQKIITRLRAYGSTKNLPNGYYRNIEGGNVPNNMAVQHLMLPSFPTETLDPYLDSDNINDLGVREGTVFFDGSGDLPEIYPTMEGMTAEDLKSAGINVNATGELDVVVSAEQISDNGVIPEEGEIQGTFTITLKDIGFDINNHLSTTGSATIAMKDGMCGGREFEIVECKKDGSNYVLTCNRSEDSGLGLAFPYKDYQIKSGDKFVLLNIEMPDVYIKAASQRLFIASKEFLAKNDYVRYSYTPSVDNIYMARQHDEAKAFGLPSIHDTIKEGDFILFEDDDLHVSGSITIDSLSIKENADESIIPEYEITLKEEKAVGTLDKIQNQISSILSGGTGNSGGGGLTVEQVKSIIVALGAKMFLSKQKDDKTPYSLEVGKDLTVGENIHSKVFSSGIVGGQGWAIRLKEWVNASGAKETKSIAEFDELVVRGLLRVSEFIISQLLGENDNRIYTGMMEVDHYDAGDGKVYLKTNGGKLYNTFRVDDIILVQQYGGMPSDDNNHYITKQYEFVVSEVGLGNIEDGEDRLDWVKFRNFSTPMEGGDESLIKEGDTLVRFDNLTDQTRKGIIQMMSVGEDAPYMDFIYGAKTDPENSLKARLGNISGVYNPLFGWLREFGAYISNLYAVGEFKIAHTGEDVSDALEIAKGLFRTNYKQSTYDVSEESNFFTNASFINNCEYWILKEDETTFFWSGDAPQFFNNEPYVSEDSFAGISEYDGRDMLRLMNATIKQENALIRKPSEHKEYSSLDEEYAKVGMDVIDTIYLGLRIYVVSGGTIEYGFVDENEAFIQNSFHVLKSLEAREEAYIESASGIWDSEGDFMIKCSGDMYIDVLSLIDKPLENLKITTSTSIEQDAKSIKLIGTKVNEVDGSITTVKQEVNAQSGTISSLVTTKVGKTEIISSINQSAEAVTIDANKINLNGVVTFSMLNSDMQNTINAKANASSLGSLAYQSSVSKAMLDSTVISGGYINTSLIDVNTLVAKKVVTNGDTHGVITYMHDGEIGMKTSSSVQLLRIYSNGSSSHIGLTDNSSNQILLNPGASSFSFSNGKYLSLNPTNGIEFSGGMGIKRFAISSIMTSLSVDGDFCIIGGNYTMPNASYLKGRVMWVYATREVTLTGSFMNSNGSSASSISCHGMNFFISNGSSWYRGYCQ